MRDSKVRQTVLPSGLTVLSEDLAGVRSIAVGLWLARGSRDETASQNGLCHFIEHMSFKGTRKRSARDIALSLEAIGGHLDAFTSKEETCYYARVQHHQLEQALDIITDIVRHSRFDPADIRREKKVVLEEIKGVDDTPDELVHELFAEAIFDGHSLSYPILGPRRNCARFTREQVIGFWENTYQPRNMLVSLAGKAEHRQLCDLLERHFPGKQGNPNLLPEPCLPDFRPSIRVLNRRISQAHICLGVPGVPYSHPGRYPVMVLNTVLGGGMSSRLFQKIREESGLAYSVYSFMDMYRDTGVLGVYLGVSPAQIKKALAMTLGEIRQLVRHPISGTELRNAKEQMKGSLLLGMESTSSRMMRLARFALHGNRYLSVDQTLANIEQVTSDQVHRLAQEIFQPRKLAAAILGPVRERDYSLDKLQDMLG
jgi:predicted Zn-dependent peptidase